MTVIRQPREPAPMDYANPFNDQIWWLSRPGVLSTQLGPSGSPSQIVSGVSSFQIIGASQAAGVLTIEGALSLITNIGAAGGPTTTQYDTNIAAFQAIDKGTFYALDNDGRLWFETAPAAMSDALEVDGDVAAFQAVDSNNAFVLGTDGKLWLEFAKQWGAVPPTTRGLVATEVIDFQASGGTAAAYVLNRDLQLAYATAPWATGGQPTTQQWQAGTAIDSPPGVELAAFAAPPEGSATASVYMIDSRGNLSQANSQNEPPFTPIDVEVAAVVPNWSEGTNALVLGFDSNLWFEYGWEDSLNREHVASNVWLPPAQILRRAPHLL